MYRYKLICEPQILRFCFCYELNSYMWPNFRKYILNKFVGVWKRDLLRSLLREVYVYRCYYNRFCKMYRVLTITFAIYSQLPRCILCETTGHTSIYDFLKSQCYYEQWNCLNLLQKARTFQNTLVSLEPRTVSHTLWKWSESRSVMSDSLQPHGLYSPWNSPDQNTGVGSLSLLQGIFPTQRLNPGLPHCRRILYQLSHKGSPLITNGRARSSGKYSSFSDRAAAYGCIGAHWTVGLRFSS